MIAASRAIQRPPEAKLLAVNRHGDIQHWPRSEFAGLFRRNDLVVANDAATLPASLTGEHSRRGRTIEVRLAARRSLSAEGIRHCTCVVFGEGDYRTQTEDRPLPPPFEVGDLLALGPLRARVEGILVQPRLIQIAFDGPLAAIWEGLARHGRPIQYSYLATPLALWDVWTPIAGPAVAFEPPSAGFALDWNALAAMKERGVHFATITHAAGISTTGDSALDARLPLDEPYRIPAATVQAIDLTQRGGGRIIAVGTTVARALEHAALHDGSVHAGEGLATQRIGRESPLRIVDAILSGTHETGTSHYDLLRAFAEDETLLHMDRELHARDYRTHEFGDSVFVERFGLGVKPKHSPAALLPLVEGGRFDTQRPQVNVPLASMVDLVVNHVQQ